MMLMEPTLAAQADRRPEYAYHLLRGALKLYQRSVPSTGVQGTDAFSTTCPRAVEVGGMRVGLDRFDGDLRGTPAFVGRGRGRTRYRLAIGSGPDREGGESDDQESPFVGRSRGRAARPGRPVRPGASPFPGHHPVR